MSWPQAKLEALAADIPNAIVGGPFGSNLTTLDYVESGVPVIRGSNMTGGRYLDTTRFVFVSETKIRRDLSSNLARENDLIFTQRGTLGQVVMIPQTGLFPLYVVSQSQMKLTVDQSTADRRFVYYYFSSPTAVGRITNLASSSGVPHINLTVLRNFELPVPPLDTQRRIADILSAYDDLIENNRRRIALLEQAARELYREWFVRLRFPGHENTRIVDGLPDGWEKIRVRDLLGRAKSRKKIKKNDYLATGRIPCIDQSKEFIGGYTNDEDAKHEDPLPIIVFGDHTRILKFVDFPFVRGADGTQLLTPNRECISVPYLYFALDAIDLPDYSYARHLKFLKDQVVLIPANTIEDKFTAFVADAMSYVKVLREQNVTLASARDLLLPRLMSGALSV